MPLWYIHVYPQCHSLISLSSMPLSDIFIFNATLISSMPLRYLYMYLVYTECHVHSLVYLSSMPLCVYFILNATQMSLSWHECHFYMFILNATLFNFILNATLWSLYHQCHSDIYCMPLSEVSILSATLITFSSMPLSYLYSQCHSVNTLSSMPLWILYPQCHSLKFLSLMPFSEVFIIDATLWCLFSWISDIYNLNATLPYNLCQRFPILFKQWWED